MGELVQVHHHLRDLGASIGASLAPENSNSGRARLIAYFRAQTGKIVHTDELMIVAGIGDYPRRIRELRSQEGWPIISGLAVRDMRQLAKGDRDALRTVPSAIAPDEYLLLQDRQDKAAPARWTEIAAMRKREAPVRTIIREFFERFPNQHITAEELRYLVGNDSAWTSAMLEIVANSCEIDGADLKSTKVPAGIFVSRN